MNFINQEIESYCLKFSSKENKILKKLYRETQHKMIMPRMIFSNTATTMKKKDTRES